MKPVRREVVPYGPEMWSKLQEPWTRIGEATGISSAFTSATWVELWLEVFGDDYQPSGLLWRAGDDIVGCALVPVRQVRVGPFELTRAYLNASGPMEAFCEHNDVLVRPAFRSAAVDDLVHFLLEELRVEELSLMGVREQTASAIGARWPAGSWNGFVSQSPYVQLERIRASERDYVMLLSSNKRSQIRRSIRLYEDLLGEPSVAEPRSVEEAMAWFDEMLALHVKSWRDRGEEGAFPSSGRLFHKQLLQRSLGAGDDTLRASLLRIRFGQTTIGVLYFLEHQRRINFYQSGLSYSDDSRLKPGLVSHTLAIRHHASRGALEYDFLGGEADTARYKQSLSTDARHLVWSDFPSRAPKMRLLRVLRGRRRWVRSMPWEGSASGS